MQSFANLRKGGAVGFHLFVCLHFLILGATAELDPISPVASATELSENLSYDELSLEDLRKLRLKLLDQQSIADASDDDDVVEEIEIQLQTLATVIQEKEAQSASASTETSFNQRPIPGGLQDGLEFYFNFDEPGPLRGYDANGQSVVGQVKGPRWIHQGRDKGAVIFDGEEAQIAFCDSVNANWSKAASVSFCVFIQPELHGLFPKARSLVGVSWENGDELVVFLSPSYRIGLKMKHNKAGQADTISVASDPSKFQVEHGRWVHIALTFNDRDLCVYIDGQLDKRVSNCVSMPDPCSRIIFGASNEASFGQIYFKGRLDDYAVWSRTLSEVEVMGYYHFLKSKSKI